MSWRQIGGLFVLSSRPLRAGWTFIQSASTPLAVSTQGQLLHHLLSLDLIPRDEVLEVRDLLGTRVDRE